MGKQTLLHMTADDGLALCAYAGEKLGLQLGRRDAEAESVALLPCESITSDSTFCIWDKQLCQDLRRAWVPDPGYYRMDTLRLPVMEYLPSIEAVWEGVPGLCQGRIFGNFEPDLGKPKQFLDSYNELLKWVKKECRKNPFGLGGYVGPSAWDFYGRGGFLLPSFVPPATPKWVSTLRKQHPSE